MAPIVVVPNAGSSAVAEGSAARAGHEVADDAGHAVDQQERGHCADAGDLSQERRHVGVGAEVRGHDENRQDHCGAAGATARQVHQRGEADRQLRRQWRQHRHQCHRHGHGQRTEHDKCAAPATVLAMKVPAGTPKTDPTGTAEKITAVAAPTCPGCALRRRGYQPACTRPAYADDARWELIRAAGVSLAELTAAGIGPVSLETTIRFHNTRRLIPDPGGRWRAWSCVPALGVSAGGAGCRSGVALCGRVRGGPLQSGPGRRWRCPSVR